MNKKPLASVGAVSAPIDELMPVIQERLSAGQEVRMYPRGVSMLPLIKEGRDCVTLSSPQGKLSKYDIALFLCGDHYVLHRVIGIGRGGYVFCGDHRCECEYGISDEQIVAVVSSIRRRDKDVRMDSIGYRAYVWLIVGRRRVRRLALRVARKIRRVFRGRKS